MRRRPIILLLLAMAALAGAAVAFADLASTQPAIKALAETPDAQVGPALAVNPLGGSPNVGAAVVGTDWRNVGQPLSAVTSGSIVASSGFTSWGPQSALPHTAQDLSFGQPDITWGPGNKVYAVEVSRDASDPGNPCAIGAGLYLFVSSNGGDTWAPPFEVLTNGPGQALTDPSIAYDAVTGRISIAYTKTDPCNALPGDVGSSSVIRLVTLTRDDGVGGTQKSAVSPQSSSGLLPQFVRPSIAVLPGGFVEVAYYDAATTPGQVLATSCTPPVGAPLAPDCLNRTVTVDDSAVDPLKIGALPVHVTPRIATDSSGRAVVTWAELTGGTNTNVYSATSRNAGASFGPPQAVPGSVEPSNQIDPSIAITKNGRADIAFLDSGYDSTGYRVAVSASNLPGGSSQTETWSQSVPVESTTITPVAPTPGPASLGGQVGVAEVQRTSGLPWTLVAWTDTRNVTGGASHNEDIYSTVLLHGATPPSGQDETVTVQRNISSPVGFFATDAEADPLTYSIAQDGLVGTAAVPDGNVPSFSYQAPPANGTDVVKVALFDGVNRSTLTVNLNIVNTPPVIDCKPALSTQVDKPLVITRDMCVTDLNNDPLTLTGANPLNGQIQNAANAVTFTPTPGFQGKAQVTLTTSDGTDPTVKTVDIQVGTPGSIPVTIAGKSARVAFTDEPINLKATPMVTGADASAIDWRYNDENAKPSDRGPSVWHLFSHVGTYTVFASIGTGPLYSVQVFVSKPPLSITRTQLGAGGMMRLRVHLGASGKLALGLLGVNGARDTQVKLKKGTHMLRMRVPASARTRGTLIVKLSLRETNGRVDKRRRAVMLPPEKHG
jgi:hypothetical protein